MKNEIRGAKVGGWGGGRNPLNFGAGGGGELLSTLKF